MRIIWGSLGVAVDGARAARKVIIVAEEIVAPEVIASDPNRTLVPGFLVAAVVHEPGGAHPSPVQGYYGRDHAFFSEYHEQSRKLEDFEKWLEQLGGARGRSPRILDRTRLANAPERWRCASTPIRRRPISAIDANAGAHERKILIGQS